MANMQPTYGTGRVAPASQMILEDHLKKCLSMTSGQQWKPYHNKNLPRALHSAFGDFPTDYINKKGGVNMQPKPLDALELSVAAKEISKYNHSPHLTVLSNLLSHSPSGLLEWFSCESVLENHFRNA